MNNTSIDEVREIVNNLGLEFSAENAVRIDQTTQELKDCLSNQDAFRIYLGEQK